MKLGTENKLKFKKLQRRLNLPLWQAKGLLDAIWDATVQNTPEGDIGRISNEDIAALIEYDGDEDELITALVETKWLDTDSEFRLIVHDWSEHVPNFLKGNFKSHNKLFADQVAKQRISGGKTFAKQPDSDPKTVANPSEQPKNGLKTLPPSQVNTSHVKSSQGNGAAAKQPRVSSSEIDEVVRHYQSHHSRSKPGAKERKLIAARLKDGFAVEDLKSAIDGNHKSPWHCGENSEQREYHRLELIMRDSDKVTEFIEILRARPQPKQRMDESLKAELERSKRIRAERAAKRTNGE